MLHSTHRALFGRRKYYEAVLATSPIAYWPQWEPSGGISRCLVDSAQNGAYTGVTLGQPGIGDGRTSPFFDGANDFNNVFTPTFRDRFALTNHGAPGAVSEGTVMALARVAQPPANPWTDGVHRYSVNLRVDGANEMGLRKTANNNELRWEYRAGGVLDAFSTGGHSDTDWMQIAMTWSATADELRGYKNGVQEGATQFGLGVWTGVLTVPVVGAWGLPSLVWHGYLAHGAVWGRACPPAEVAYLYNEAFR